MLVKAAAACALLAAAVTACSSGISHPPPSAPSSSASSPSSAADTTFDLSGTLTLYGEISSGVDAMKPGAPCMGITNPDSPDEDFEDIAEGTPLTVTDGSHTTVGAGELGGGTLGTVNPLDSRTCVFDLSISGILAGRHFYTLAIGDHETKTYSEDEFRNLSDLSFKSLLYSGSAG